MVPFRIKGWRPVGAGSLGQLPAQLTGAGACLNGSHRLGPEQLSRWPEIPFGMIG